MTFSRDFGLMPRYGRIEKEESMSKVMLLVGTRAALCRGDGDGALGREGPFCEGGGLRDLRPRSGGIYEASGTAHRLEERRPGET